MPNGFTPLIVIVVVAILAAASVAFVLQQHSALTDSRVDLLARQNEVLTRQVQDLKTRPTTTPTIASPPPPAPTPRPAPPTPKPTTPSAPLVPGCDEALVNKKISFENNGNPNGNRQTSSAYGKVTFNGIVKTNLYKFFYNTQHASCLEAEYTTWTQLTGEQYQQTLAVTYVKQAYANPEEQYGDLWLQYVRPAESDAAMFAELDAAIATVQATGYGPAQRPGAYTE